MSSNNEHAHTCFIVPPHVLRGVAEYHGHSDQLRAAATAALSQRKEVDERRFALTTSIPDTQQRFAPATPFKPVHRERQIYNCAHTTTLPGTIQRKEGEPPVADVSVNEVYDSFGYTFDLYYKIFGRNGIDDAGLTMIGSVHYGVKYDNAFWNGTEMVFGDGDNIIFGSFTKDIDVIGHELTHGVTQYSSGLIYQGQSGALNESISDVFGSMVKQFHLKQQSVDADWLIGAGLFAPGISGIALRSMSAPGTAYNDPKIGGKDPQPANMLNFVITTADAGGVHINSGIPNHAFYLIAIRLGGYSWERAGRIWYATCTDPKLKAIPHATFKEFAELTVHHAKQFGAHVQEIVHQAWKDVSVL